VVCVHSGVYSAIKMNEIMSFAGKMGGTGHYHVNWNKSATLRQASCVFFSFLEASRKK
jgi:hypothetical protein